MTETIYYHPDQSLHYVVHTYLDNNNEVLASPNRTLLIYLN
jgi:hypothetical protein